MQKLEEILRAEEAARHSLADVRERAKVAIREAETAATDMAVAERRRTAEEAASIEREADEAAQTEAEAIRAQSAAALEDELTLARHRMNDVIERVVAELTG